MVKPLTSDFAAIVSDVSDSHEIEPVGTSQKQTTERDSNNCQGNRASKWLRNVVMPLLADGMAALERERIQAKLNCELEFPGRVAPNPWLSISCSAPGIDRPNDGANNIQSTAFFIDCDGDFFRVGYNGAQLRRPDNWSIPRPIEIPNINEFIAEGIKLIAESYHAEVRKRT